MSMAGTMVAIAALLASLFLAVRGLQARGLTFERKAAMAAAWAVIIGVLAFVMSRVAG